PSSSFFIFSKLYTGLYVIKNSLGVFKHRERYFLTISLINNRRIWIDELTHGVSRVTTIPILNCTVSRIETFVHHYISFFINDFILTSLNLIIWIGPFHISSSWLPIRTIIKNRSIKTWVTIFIRRSSMNWIIPIKWSTIDHFIIIYQVLRRRVS